MVTASEDDLKNHLIYFKTELAAYRDPKVVENKKEVDTYCKKLEDPEYEDVQLKFIKELFGKSEDFEIDGFSDDGKDDKKDQSDSSDHDEPDVKVKPKVDDEFEEELETSQYGAIWKQILFI